LNIIKNGKIVSSCHQPIEDQNNKNLMEAIAGNFM